MPKKAKVSKVSIVSTDPNADKVEWKIQEDTRMAWRNRLDRNNVSVEKTRLLFQSPPEEFGQQLMYHVMVSQLEDKTKKAILDDVHTNPEQRAELAKWATAITRHVDDADSWFRNLLEKEEKHKEFFETLGGTLELLAAYEENQFESLAPPAASAEDFYSHASDVFTITLNGKLLPTTFHASPYSNQFEWIRAEQVNNNMRDFLTMQLEEAAKRITLLMNHQLSPADRAMINQASLPGLLFADDQLDTNINDFSDRDQPTGTLRKRIGVLNRRDPWNRLFVDLLHLFDRSDLLTLQNVGCADASALECLLAFVKNNEDRLMRRYRSYMFDMPGQLRSTLNTYYGEVDSVIRWVQVDQKLRKRGDLLIRLGSHLDLESTETPFHLRTVRMMANYRLIVARLNVVLYVLLSSLASGQTIDRLVSTMLVCCLDVTPVDVVRKLTLLRWAIVNQKEADPSTLSEWICHSVDDVENKENLLLKPEYINTVTERFKPVFPEEKWPENYRAWIKEDREKLEKKVSRICPEVFSPLPIDTYLFGWAHTHGRPYAQILRFTQYMGTTFGPVPQVSPTDYQDWTKRVQTKANDVEKVYQMESTRQTIVPKQRIDEEKQSDQSYWRYLVFADLAEHFNRPVLMEDMMKHLRQVERISILESVPSTFSDLENLSKKENIERSAHEFAKGLLEKPWLQSPEGWQAVLYKLQQADDKEARQQEVKPALAGAPMQQQKEVQEAQEEKGIYQEVLNWLNELEKPPVQEFGRKQTSYAFADPIHRLIEKMSLTR